MDILCLKLSRANGTLSKLRHFAPLKTCLSVYYTILYSHLLHGCPAWSYAKEINIDRVNKPQKRCIRILTFSDFNLHTSDLSPKLKLFKVQDNFTLLYLELCKAYKVFHLGKNLGRESKGVRGCDLKNLWKWSTKNIFFFIFDIYYAAWKFVKYIMSYTDMHHW